MVRASEVHPQVIVYEDVHWMDQATEESLVFAADSIPNSRILQILTYEPAITILSAKEPIIRGLRLTTSLLRTAPR